jgi:hypothetical protein
MKNGIFDLSGDEAAAEATQTPPTGPRVYSPGFRPWVEQYQSHLPNDGGVGAFQLALPAKIASGEHVGLALLVIGGTIVVAGIGLYALMGHYVGRKLGTNWGWFWGLGGPIGIAAMQGYRQHKGKTTATPNRRRRHRRSRRR